MAKNKKNIKQEIKKSTDTVKKATVQPIRPEEVKKRNIAFIGFGIVVLFYIFIWIEPGMKGFEDPWYTAIKMVDSSRKVTNESQKAKLLEEGGSQLKKLATIHPYHARVHHYLGIYYTYKQDWDRAIAEQSKAIELGSGGLVNNVEYDAHRELIFAIFSKANAFAEKKQLDSAIEFYNKAVNESGRLRLSSKTAELMGHVNFNLSIAYMQKGNKYLEMNNLDSALVYFEKSVAINPRMADALNNMGTIYSKMNNQAKALEYFSKALAIDPENKNALNNLNAIKKSYDTKENVKGNN
jgi:tetratricopeptide (TPR) repeat protein